MSEQNTVDSQPDGSTAWRALEAKLNADEIGTLKLAIQSVTKSAYVAGFKAGANRERQARKDRNAAKHERKIILLNGHRR